jgi:hypothetical protein
MSYKILTIYLQSLILKRRHLALQRGQGIFVERWKTVVFRGSRKRMAES